MDFFLGTLPVLSYLPLPWVFARQLNLVQKKR